MMDALMSKIRARVEREDSKYAEWHAGCPARAGMGPKAAKEPTEALRES